MSRYDNLDVVRCLDTNRIGTVHDVRGACEIYVVFDGELEGHWYFEHNFQAHAWGPNHAKRENEILWEIFVRSPEEALDTLFKRSQRHMPWVPERAFLHTCMMGNHGLHRYGSSKYVTKAELVGRKYQIEYWDDSITLFFTDVVHDPKTYKDVPIDVTESKLDNPTLEYENEPKAAPTC